MHAAVMAIAHDAAEVAEGSSVPPWVIGVTAFGILVVLLIVTMMIKVER